MTEKMGFNPDKEELNETHTELREGEVFWGNSKKEKGLPSYRTARFGNTAYDDKGKTIEGLFPIFANKQEVDET